MGGIFHFYSNSNRTFCKQTVETLISFAVSDSGLRCLPLSHKKEARLIKVKLPFVIKIFVWSIFEWLFYTGFTVSLCVWWNHLGLDATKPVFGVSGKVRLKLVCSATETS